MEATLPSTDFKLVIGVLLCKGRINKAVFREFYIWAMDKYPDKPVSEWNVIPQLIDWLCFHHQDKDMQFSRFTSDRIRRVSDIMICLEIIYTEEEQFQIWDILMGRHSTESGG